jgi:putative FmdB family regulatory protein
MPTYDYKCVSCSNVFEKFHGISETPEITCPQCGNKSDKQIGAGAGIHYKGTGFYTTDYKSSGKVKETAAPSSCSTGGCGCG